jgi:hypothetical protein
MKACHYLKEIYNMKKSSLLLIVVLCLLMAGCSNKFAENEYDSVEEIVESEDRYAKESSVFNPIDGGYSLVVSKFDGRQTLWTDTLEESQSVEIEFSFALTEGKAKMCILMQTVTLQHLLSVR